MGRRTTSIVAAVLTPGLALAGVVGAGLSFESASAASPCAGGYRPGADNDFNLGTRVARNRAGKVVGTARAWRETDTGHFTLVVSSIRGYRVVMDRRIGGKRTLIDQNDGYVMYCLTNTSKRVEVSAVVETTRNAIVAVSPYVRAQNGV